MAGNSITVSTEEVRTIAQKLEGLNNDLYDLLQKSKQTIDNLPSIWEGSASSATVEAYDSFAASYFQNYKDVVQQYVEFLRRVVAEGYDKVETANTSLADNFK